MGALAETDYRGILGRYALYGEIAAGGMATVHFGRLLGPVGFSRTVAIKRLHPHLAKDPEFARMFLDEARLAARIRHPNVAATLDVVALEGELFLVMEYVMGESLSRLVRVSRRDGKTAPPKLIVAIMCGALDGLHAAHEAKSERGAPLGIVHRDVSPQNVLVGVDGVPRVLDFGVAKATNRASETRSDQIKGKVAYMAPEQLARGTVDRRTDVFAASVVLWAALTGERLFKGDDVASLAFSVISEKIRRPSELAPEISPELDAVVMRGLERDQDARWASARDMAMALEKACPPASAREIGHWVESVAGEALAHRAEIVADIESQTSGSMPPPCLPGPSHPGPPPSSPELSSGVVSGPGRSGSESQSALRAGEVGATTSAASNVTSLAVEASSVALAPARSTGLWIAVIALSVALFAGGAIVIGTNALRRDPVKAAVASPPLAPSVEPAPPDSLAKSPLAIDAPPPLPMSIVATPASAAASASAKTRAASGGVHGGVARPPVEPKPSVPAVAPHPPPPSEDCENPFTVDATGIRRPKPHCFGKQ